MALGQFVQTARQLGVRGNQFAGIILAAILGLIPAAGATVGQTAAQALNPAEQWVVESVLAGNVADLREKFPAEKDRQLGGPFLEDLLTGALPGAPLGRRGVRIAAATISEPIDLRNAQISSEVQFVDCRFTREVSFAHAVFAAGVGFENCTFQAAAYFYGSKVGNEADFRKCVFEGAVNFSTADIGSNFQADEAQFNSKADDANFARLRVEGLATFDQAVFAGRTLFIQARIGVSFNASQAKFNNPEQIASFNSMKVGTVAKFDGAVFAGPLDFGALETGSNFEVVETQFLNTKQGASFNGMKVGAAFLGQKAIFAGPVNFGWAAIATNFEAQGAEFRDKTEVPWLALKCGGIGYFDDATFAAGVSFAEGSFLDLAFSGTKANAAPLARLDLSRSSIKGILKVAKIRIHDFVAESVHVEGAAFLTDIVVEHSADLSQSDFTTLSLAGSVWPKDRQQGGFFSLQGMSYKYLSADADEARSHEALLHLADQSAFTADVYSSLETFFAGQGYSEDADRAFIAGKRRERREYLHGLHEGGSWLLDALVGYGRHPAQAGYPCAFFVALGSLLFSARKMELQNPDDASRVYNPFWYSLGLFLPFVDLQADKVWKPKPEHFFLRNYLRVHILLGWILIPIVLAALTGLIK